MPGPLPRPRLRLSLRMLLLLILIVAVGLASQINKARRQREAVAQIERAGGFVFFDDEDDEGGELPDAHYRWTNWLRGRLGKEYFRGEKHAKIHCNEPLNDIVLAPLVDLWRIEELTILIDDGGKGPKDPPHGTVRLTERGLAGLESLARLRHLTVVERKWTGSWLRHLRFPPGLEVLEIIDLDQFQDGITDEKMPPFEKMPHLRSLLLSCDRLTGSCLESLRGSTSLEELIFDKGSLSADGFRNIGTMTNLKTLFLMQDALGENDLSELRNLANLTRLGLYTVKSKIDDAGLDHLAGMAQIEGLNLRGSRITGRGLAALKGMRRLKALSLEWTSLQDEDLGVFAEFPRLESLGLDGTNITDVRLDHLKSLKNPKHLSLRDTAVTQQGLADLQKSLPGLTETDF